MDDWRKQAFEFARDTTNQLITLATGVLTLTITLATAFSDDVPVEIKSWLMSAWVSYLLSIIFGVWTLMALTGTLEPITEIKAEPSIRGRNVVLPSVLQIGCFLIGTASAVWIGIIRLG